MPFPPATQGHNFPAIAYSAHDEYLLAWTTNKEILGIRLNANGFPKYYNADFRAIVLPLGTTSIEAPLGIAYAEPYDEFVLIWSDGQLLSNTGLDLHMRVLKGEDGQPAGKPFMLGQPFGPTSVSAGRTRVVGNQIQPVVAYNPHMDEYLVIWADDSTPGSKDWDFYGQRFRADDKTPKGDPYPILIAPGNQTSPSLVYSQAEQTYLLAWNDDRNSPSAGWDIYAMRLIGETGKPLAYEFPVVQGPGNQLYPALTYNPSDGNHYLVYSDDGAIDSQHLDIYGIRLNGNGMPFGRPIMVSTADGRQITPTLGASSDDAIVAIWSDYRNTASSSEVWGRRLNGNGMPFGPEYAVIRDGGIAR